MLCSSQQSWLSYVSVSQVSACASASKVGCRTFPPAGRRGIQRRPSDIMQTFSPPCQRLPFEGTHSTPRSLAVSPRYYPARARLSSWRKQVGRPKAVLAFFHGGLPGAGAWTWASAFWCLERGVLATNKARGVRGKCSDPPSFAVRGLKLGSDNLFQGV